MRINIYNTTDRPRIKKEYIRKLVRRVLRKEGKEINSINIIIADSLYLRNLNKSYFKKNKKTNVISFDLGEISEIYVADEKATGAFELHYYILHGLLHLLGYDHRDEHETTAMHKKCTEYLRNG
ncbi:MAG: rRNA maturation RNAse YbeY [candidate division WOR-3 bacterium]|nr:MAG: rRNA maturation RNAse YbeY [candidate division WOR-3 bacterium]